MTRKQMALMVLLSAVVSAFVSLAIVAGAVLLLRDRVAFVTSPAEVATRPAAAPSEGEQPTTAEGDQPATVEPGQAAAGATPVVHTVVSGDTISGLALQYDVPADDIIAANQLENPNFLTVGAKLVIPVGGLELVEPTKTPQPTATDTPIPYEPPSAQMTATAAAEAGATITPLPTPLPVTGELQIEIVEVVKPGVAAEEGVTIANRGSRLADMSGWALSDAAGNTYTFPSYRLWSGATVTIYTREGQNGSPPDALYWRLPQAVWSDGEQVMLKDTAGETMATYTVGE